MNSLNLKWDVFDKLQIKVLEAFEGGCDVDTVIKKIDIPQAYAEGVVDLLLTAGLLKKTPEFPTPCFMDPPEVMSIWVQTSNICNLQCSYCYIVRNNNRMSNAVWLQFKKKIFQTAEQRKLKRVTLRLGGGEPTLTLKNYTRYLEDTKNELGKIGCEFGIVLITNLTIVTPEMIEFVKRMNCSVSVSLDGLGEFHDKSRMFINGDGSFNSIEKNLNLLIEQGIRPMTLTVVSENNLDGLPEFTKFILKKNLFFRYNLVINFGIGCLQEKLVRILKRCYKIIENYMDSHPGYDFDRKHAFCNLMTSGPVFQGCNAGYGALTLNTDGSIYVCQTVLRDGKSCGTIWDKEDLLTVSMNQKEYPLWIERPECDSCNIRFICAGGCPLHEQKEEKSVLCRTFQEIAPILYKLKGKQRLSLLFNDFHQKPQNQK
ncbi:MAG: radical SAM protein [Candidatus Niyogibacteria bacterium]|nr:radical SAM protein [Candidatus Niyogibacteria bacterium]